MEAILAPGSTLLAVVLWTSAALGVLAIVVASSRPSKRRPALLVAALLFLPIGVLGILSIGIFFLAAAALCLLLSALPRSKHDGDTPPRHDGAT